MASIKRYGRILIRGLMLLILVMQPQVGSGAESVLVRLFFEVPVGRMAAFETAYREALLPALRAQELTEASTRGRETPDGIFSRLFELGRPPGTFETAILEAYEGDRSRVLEEEPGIRKALKMLGSTFGTTRSDGLIPFYFILYSMPSGPGRIAPMRWFAGIGSNRMTKPGM